jgi:hypothetical protein
MTGTPLCDAPSGACVACLDATSCPADKQTCDATAHSCRGCARDEECPGGICVEADGTCVADAVVLFLDGAGTDTGTCARQAPCGTLAFALSKVQAGAANHIKILSRTFSVPAAVTLGPSLYLEGSATIFTGPANMFAIPQLVNISLSHLTLQPASGPAITVGSLQTLRLFDVQTAVISVNGGSLDVDRGTLTNGGLDCTSGTVTVQRSVFADSSLNTMTCQVIVRRTRFDLLSGAHNISIQGGLVTYENNLLTQAEGIADSMSLLTVAAGSTVRFNTFVNTAALASDGVALQCEPQVDVSSNIFAYNSAHPLTDCTVRYSLLDSVALPQFSAGVGNKAGDSTSFFLDKPSGDFHLSASSPARQAGEPGLGITEDFDGSARPAPQGSVPDIGAFEAR